MPAPLSADMGRFLVKAEQQNEAFLETMPGLLLDQQAGAYFRLFGDEDLAQGGVGLDDLDQQDAQHGAADELADADGDAVGDAGQPQRGRRRRVGEEDGDLNADDDGVEEHRRQRSCQSQTLEAEIPQLVGHKAGQQGGQCAEDDVHDGGTQQVGQEAAQHDAGDVLRAEHGQQAERLGHTHLHCAVGERLQCHAEHHVNGCDHSAAGQLADRRILIHNTILRRMEF